MGIYDDIQTDVKEALLTDLSDAYLDFSVTNSGATTYNTTTGNVTSSDTTVDFKGVRIKFIEGADLDLPEESIILQILVLDSDKPLEFEKKQIITHLSKTYRIAGIDRDPANATWTLDCTKYG